MIVDSMLIQFAHEDDGRWIAEVPSLPGVMAYGATKQEANSKVRTIALKVLSDLSQVKSQAHLRG